MASSIASLSSYLRSKSSVREDQQDRVAEVTAVKRKNVLKIGGLFWILLLVVMFASGAGAVQIPAIQVVSILLSKLGLPPIAEYTTQHELVLIGIRLPRVVLGVIAGMGLSISGALMQGLFRNPLADPALIGVSSGASLGASIMIVVGSLLPGFIASSIGIFSIALSAFTVGLLVTLIVYRIATHGAQTSVATMLLAGIALNALCGAGTGALVLFADDTQLRDLTFWSLGSLGSATWHTLAIVTPFTLIALFFSPRLARSLNAMLLGEAEARHLGVDTERIKKFVIFLSALAVGSVTAVTGLIGFVGLVVPHLIRLTLGPDHRILLPGSALLGAILMVGADLLARILIQPSEIPIGILTAFGGAPFFLWLLLRGYSRANLQG